MMTVDLSDGAARRASAARSCCGARASRSTTSRPRRRRSATSCCAPSRRACRSCARRRPVDIEPEDRDLVYIVVTGAAGFIGSNLVKALNARGERDIIAVDNLTHADKFRNLVDCEIADYFDKEEFLARLGDGDFDDDIAAVLHQGACSDTMETDGRYMMRNNYRYSVTLLEHCQDNDVPFLYASSASVYGAGTRVPRGARVRGAAQRLRLFEVPVRPVRARACCPSAPRRSPASAISTFTARAKQHKGRDGVGRVSLLQPVSQRRPRAAVRGLGRLSRTASSAATSFTSTTSSRPTSISSITPSARGIFNLGTGTAATFNAVARGDDQRVPSRRRRPAARAAPSSSATERSSTCRFPAALAGKYQSFTAGRPLAACAQRATTRRCWRSMKACRATSKV